MTATNGDGIEEDLIRAVGMAMIAASRAGEQMARMRQSADRERQARAAGDAARAQRELAAHTEAARAYFQVVNRPEYLHAASDEQIREVTRQAQAWTERLPEAQRAADAAAAELGARRPAVDSGPQRSAVLAGQAETADQRAAADQQETQPSARQAAARASSAQARPAQEAAAAARNVDRQGAERGGHRAAPRVQLPGVGI